MRRIFAEIVQRKGAAGKTVALPEPIDFIIILIRSDNPKQLSERVSDVLNRPKPHEVVISSFCFGLITMVVSPRPSEPPQREKRLAVVNALLDRHTTEIKIVHGSVIALFSPVDDEDTFGYPRYLEGFDRHLTALCSLRFGESLEL